MMFPQRVTSSRIEFPKPTEQYAVLRLFGRNILTEEGEEWKKYKRICAPAFSEVRTSTMSVLDIFLLN